MQRILRRGRKAVSPSFSSINQSGYNIEGVKSFLITSWAKPSGRSLLEQILSRVSQCLSLTYGGDRRQNPSVFESWVRFALVAHIRSETRSEKTDLRETSLTINKVQECKSDFFRQGQASPVSSSCAGC